MSHTKEKKAIWGPDFKSMTPAEIEAWGRANNELLRAAIKNVLAATGVGVGVGMGARGLLSLKNLVSRREDSFQPPPRLTTISVPLPKREEEKHAAFGDVSKPSLNPVDALSSIVQYDPNAPWQGRSGLMGQFSESPHFWDIPWFLPALTTGSMGGAVGGYKLVDWLMDARRKKDLESDLESAREDYRRALVAQHLGKVSSADTTEPDIHDQLASDLDKLADQAVVTLEKQATYWPGVAAGMYGTVMLPMSFFAALAAYRAARENEREELLRKAYTIHQRREFTRHPPDLMADIEPVPTPATPSLVQ